MCAVIPAVANGIVYVGANDVNEIYALNAQTGVQLWNFTTGSGVYDCPAVAGGFVYFGSIDNSTYALNAETGALVWSYKTGNNIYSSPAVVNGVTYADHTTAMFTPSDHPQLPRQQ